jgi:hypothetical protein
MSQLLIQQYLNQLADLRKVSGTSREMVVREAFKDLLKGYARSHDLVFIPEYEIETPAKERRYVDGALLHALRVPFGYWEAKDEKDDLNTEIEHKLRRGYPQDNIVFEDSREVVLLQNKQVVMRAPVDDVARLELLLDLFFGYERPEINQFRKAVEQFKTDLPAVLDALREMIAKAAAENPAFRAASKNFLAHAQETINPSLTDADVREMPLKRTDAKDDGHTPKAMLKADKENGRILLDSRTTLSGIPPEAWAYKLGNRSAMEWILDQYKEKKPKDPTIREKFNTYRFADYKEKVIDLLQRVTTVSVRTMKITEAMKNAPR